MANSYKIYAVYDADGTALGELVYLAGKLLGTRECALCDISHGWNPLGKPRWREAQRGAADVHWLHRDEQSDAMAVLTRGRLPAVILERGGHFEILLERESLSACDGDYAAFEALLARRLIEVGVVKGFC